MRLEAKSVSFRYTASTPLLLQAVSFYMEEGERVGLTAPSGYGKTTFAKLLAGYEHPAEGNILFNGEPLPKTGISPVQMVFQHPETAINPRWKMRRVLEEAGPLDEQLLSALDIHPQWLARYPRELSGGELQRFCLARALAPGTRLLIADEISAMLDAITQAQIWHYLLSEAARRHIGLLVVSHNMRLLERVCTRVVDLRDINGAEALLFGRGKSELC